MIFLTGGFSHVDTFDYKPALSRYHGKSVPSFRPAQRRDPRPPAPGLAVSVPGVRPIGPDDQRAVPEPGDDGRRAVRDPHAAHRHRRAFPGGPGHAHRLGHRADAGPGCLAQLWPGHVQPRSAVVHGALRAHAVRRHPGLGQQLPAADPPGGADRAGPTSRYPTCVRPNGR